MTPSRRGAQPALRAVALRRALTGRLLLIAVPLARANRRRLRGTVFVAITGSAGKTTAKRLTAAVLRQAGPVVALPGTSNQRRAIVSTLLRTGARHRFSVLELGAGGRRPFEELIALFAPQVAIVTSVGADHRSRFGGPDGVAREKRKLVAALPESGVAVLNADDERVREMAAATRARTVLFGFAPDADVRAEEVSARWPDRLSFVAVHGDSRQPVQTRLVGEHWAHAALAAIAAGVAVGVPVAAAAAALAEVEPTPHRLSVATGAPGVTFLQDDWKASVTTVGPALELLGRARARRRVAVLGHVADDVRSPRRLYAALAREARERADLVVLVGEWAHHGLRARSGQDDGSIVAFASVAEASRFLGGALEPGDLVLIKASLVDHVERLALAQAGRVDCWRTRCGRWVVCEECRLLARRWGRR